jgi:hypothetical protein
MKGSEWPATTFKNLMGYGFMSKDLNTICFLEEKRTPAEGGLNWAIRFGYIFDFYQGKSKNIVFLDSTNFRDPYQLN